MAKTTTSMVWVTKYSLTKGIMHLKGLIDNEKPTNCYVGTLGFTLGKGEWHRTEEEAHRRVLEMIAHKRRNVSKLINKLDSLERECSQPTV